MSAWAQLENATVHVATRTGSDEYGDPTYGTPTPVSVRLVTRVVRAVSAAGVASDVVTRLATDRWTFARTDAIWLPGTDTDDAGAAVNPARIGFSSAGGISLSTAEL